MTWTYRQHTSRHVSWMGGGLDGQKKHFCSFRYQIHFREHGVVVVVVALFVCCSSPAHSTIKAVSGVGCRVSGDVYPLPGTEWLCTQTLSTWLIGVALLRLLSVVTGYVAPQTFTYHIKHLLQLSAWRHMNDVAMYVAMQRR